MSTWLTKLWGPRASCTLSPPSVRRRPLRLAVEQLEGRLVPASYTAATPSMLLADIQEANTLASLSSTPVQNTITLAPGASFAMTSSPSIWANNYLTIVGNGDVMMRDTSKNTPAVRFFFINVGASLTVTNLTLEGATLGAIRNYGNLSLKGVTLQNNTSSGSGGAIASYQATSTNGDPVPLPSLVMQDCIVRNNQVLLGKSQGLGVAGGNAMGGGVFVGAGTADLTNVTFSGKCAQGGEGSKGGWTSYAGYRIYVPSGNGGDGRGGGMYVDSATVNLHSCTFESNSVIGGKGGPGAPDGEGIGGGLYIENRPGVTIACLDLFTVAHALNNTADVDPNIHGSYSICS